MGLKETFEKEMKECMKAKDTFKLGVLRFLIAQIKNKEIDARKPLTDEEILKIIHTLVKQRKESLAFSEQAGRQDLIDKEKMELGLLESYLPKLLTAEELERMVEEAMKEVNAAGMKDMGKVMKQIMPRVAGRADGGAINEIVKKKLSS